MATPTGGILHSPEELNYILCYQSRRVLSKNLTFQYKTSAYQIRSEGQGYRLRHAIVTVCENFNGEITVLYESRPLGYEKYVDGLNQYRLMMKRAYMSVWIMRVIICALNITSNLLLTIPGRRGERRVKMM